MSCDAQSFLIRTAAPTSTWFNGQASHWTSTELARESVLEIFASPAEPPWKHRRQVAFMSCSPSLRGPTAGRVQINSIHEDGLPQWLAIFY